MIVTRNHSGCTITYKDCLEEAYDGCVIATHAPDALKILGKQATYDELRILGAFQYGNRFPVNMSFSFLSAKLAISRNLNLCLLYIDVL